MRRSLLISAMILVVGIIIGMWLCRTIIVHDRTAEVQKDTVIVRDTIKIESPKETKIEYFDKTILVEVKDTIYRKDTLYISLPLEKRTYKREDFYAEVTGYEPRLTYIEVYPKTITITKKEAVTKCNALRLGIEASYSSYLSTPIYLEYERMLHKNVGIYAGVYYDMVSDLSGVKVGANLQIGW